jgi:hypothetical protein
VDPAKPKSKRKPEPFSHEIVYFIVNGGGRECHRKIYPSRLHALALAIGIRYGNLDENIRKVYAQELVSRMSGYIEQSCAQAGVSAAACKRVFATNAGQVVGITFRRRYKNPNYMGVSSKEIGGGTRILTRSEKELNASIFVMKLSHTIQWLVQDKRTRRVIRDFQVIGSLRTDPDRFPRIEKLAAPQLGKFMKSGIRGIDRESQLQEGRLALWAAARGYEARNFSTFGHFARVALDHKFCNLLRYSLADKRRVNRSLVPIGGNIGDSYTGSQVDSVSYAHWEAQQSIYDAADEEIGRRIRHNGLPALGVLRSKLGGDAAAVKLFEMLVHGNPERTVSGADLNGEVLPGMSPFAKWLLYKKNFGLKGFEREARFRGDGNDGTFWEKLPEADESNFPHLNEGTVEVSDSLPDAAEKYLDEYHGVAQVEMGDYDADSWE